MRAGNFNFTPVLFTEIHIEYVHPGLNIGIQDIRNVWLLGPEPVLLRVALHRGNLVYRMPVTGQRISYKQLKEGLVKKAIKIKLPLNRLPS